MQTTYEYQVIMRLGSARSGAPQISINYDHEGGKLVLAGDDVASISITSVPMKQDAVQRPPGLRTDVDIGSRTTGVTGGNCSGERNLPKEPFTGGERMNGEVGGVCSGRLSERGGGAKGGVETGGGGIHNGVPCYSSAVEGGGWWGLDSGTGHMHDSRNLVPPRYTADVQGGRPLANLAFRESCDKTFPATREDGGIGQWPGNIPHGSPPGGWCHSNPPNGEYAVVSHWNSELVSSDCRDEDRVPEQGGEGSGSGNWGDDLGHYKGKEGDVIGGRYKLRADMGQGTFGRVVECWDMEQWRRVAVKIVRKAKNYDESALIEAQILRDVNDRERDDRCGPNDASLCVKMFDHFEHQRHCCLVFECLGPSLHESLMKNGRRGFPLNVIRPIARELLQAIEFLHSIKLIHTDLKPENILLTSWDEREVKLDSGDVIRVPATPHIKVIDFGSATYENGPHASIVTTRPYRAPEVILGMRWSYPSDLWSIGCIIAELVFGDRLFETHDDHEHLAMMEKCVGPFPSAMLTKAPQTANFFDKITECDLENRRHTSCMTGPQNITAPVESTDEENLVEKLLTLEPESRATATEALRDHFFEHM